MGMISAPLLSTSRAVHAPSGGGRLDFLDLARALAVIGMMSAHLLAPLAAVPGSSDFQGLLARAAALFAEGYPSTLFAVIGGSSLVLSTRRRLAVGDRRGAVVSALVRGLCVCVIGLVLELLPSSVMVVLVPFGLAMMITAPLLLVPSRVLVPLIAVIAVGGHPLAMAVPGRVELGTVTLLSLADPLAVLRGIVLTGQYPLITLVPYLLTGVVLMRGLLRAHRSLVLAKWSRRVAAGGVLAAALGHALPLLAGAFGHAEPGSWYMADPHTGTLGDMLATAGVAAALIGLLTGLLPADRRVHGRLSRAVRAAGAAPLTLYVGHVLLTSISLILAVVLSGGELVAMPWYVAGAGVLCVHVTLAIGLGALLAAKERRGPLEALLGRVVRRSAPNAELSSR